MSDNYQAVYDAVRSKLHNCDVERAIKEACSLDASTSISVVQAAFQESAWAMAAPSVLYRPALSIDGDMWCALYGEDLQSGVAGFGKSPALAMADFDREFAKGLTP